MEAEYVKANSTNLLKIDVLMVYQFIMKSNRFNIAEMRRVKTSVYTQIYLLSIYCAVYTY